LVHTALLQHDPHARHQRVPVAPGVQPQHRDLAAVGAAESLQALDGRGLARPVGAEQREDADAGHCEGQPVDDGRAVVGLAQVADADGGGHRLPLSRPRGRTAKRAAWPAAGRRYSSVMTPDDPADAPDPRFFLAAERTFLAWQRTALALVAVGFAAAELLPM